MTTPSPVAYPGLIPYLQNAFSDCLSPLGFDVFSMFTVDLMHDFELGGWRALFIHLLRILDTSDGNLLMELDHR
jgi:hypothetical protein